MGGRQQQLQQQQHRRRRRRRRWKNQCVHFFTREKRASCEAKKHAETICSIYLVWRLSESDAINIKCNQNNKMHPYESIEISQWLSVRAIKNASERKKTPDNVKYLLIVRGNEFELSSGIISCSIYCLYHRHAHGTSMDVSVSMCNIICTCKGAERCLFSLFWSL